MDLYDIAVARKLSGGSGGGGGSSDFTTATVTLNNPTGKQFYAPVLVLGGPFDYINPLGGNVPSDNYAIVLYKGNALATVPNGSVQISGAIESVGYNGYCITGDCTLTIS